MRLTDPDGRIPIDTIWDLGSILYDIGKIGVGYATDDTALVSEGAVDLAADTVALAIPYVPAGTTKLLRYGDEAIDAARGVDRAVDAARTTDNAVDTARSAESATSTVSTTNNVATTAATPTPRTSSGRGRSQERLRQVADDPNTSRADRGWIRQEQNSIARGQRSTIRNPPGRQLAHTRGREAAKGYDHVDSPSNLQNVDLHRTQHRYDNQGRANRERTDP